MKGCRLPAFGLLCLLTFCWIGRAELTLNSFQGWEGAITLSNQAIEVVVVPQTGRMVHLSKPGAENFLTFNADLSGVLPSVEEGDWLNYGGDWMWPVHQSRWEAMGGQEWPPLRMLDAAAWHAEALTEENGTQVVTLRRDLGAPVYVELTRTFRLAPGNDPTLELHQSIRRIQASSIPVTLWQIAQTAAPDQVFLDIHPETRFPDGVHKINFDPPPSNSVERCEDVLVLAAAEVKESKLGSEGEWIAAAKGNTALWIQALGGESGGAIPDDGSRVVVYANNGLNYAEIETQSAEVDLAPGEVLRNTLRYRLVDLEAGQGSCAHARQLDAFAPQREKLRFVPESPHPEDIIRVEVRTNETGGMLHWGVNGPEGDWELPDPVYWPEGSVAGKTGVAVDTPLPDPVDGVSVLELGPFDQPEQIVESLHAALRWGDRWESRDGKNFNLELTPHPSASNLKWDLREMRTTAGGLTATVTTAPPADRVEIRFEGRLLGEADADTVSVELQAQTWPFGPNRIQARAIRRGRVNVATRTIWKVPETETDSWPEEQPYGIEELSPGQWRVHLLAPAARFVELEWTENGSIRRRLMKKVGPGRWGLEISVASGTPFSYRYVINGESRFADPWSKDVVWVTPEGEGAESHLPEHAWTRVGELPAALEPWDPPPRETWVIYELSIPDVAPPGSYSGLEERLAYIAELGVNAIEPLPVTAFPGDVSWGYNPAFHMALERSYGTPQEFASLIRSARSRGIAYVKDIVLNHVDGSGPLNRMHGDPSTNPFIMPFDQFNWGFPKLDQQHPAFKRYVKDTLQHWVRHWGVDGYRYDATQWIQWGGYNEWGASWMAYVVNEANPDVLQIAENLPSEPPMVEGTELDAEWDGHFRWRMRKIFTEQQITEPEKMREILDPRNHAYMNGGQRVPYIESHDEERFVRELKQKGFSETEAFRRHHAAAAITLTVPGIPMLYAGQEWGEETQKVVGPNPLQWELREIPARAVLEQNFRELIELRVNHRALHHDRIDILHLNAETGMVAYIRPGVPESVVVAFNVSDTAGVLELPDLGIPIKELHTNVLPERLQAITLKPGQARIFIVGTALRDRQSFTHIFRI